MKRVKNHAAIPVLLFAIIIIVVNSVQIYSAKEDGSFQLRDIEGDRKAIENITITGALGDSYHNTRFQIVRGAVMHQTELYDQPLKASIWNHDTGDRRVAGDMMYRAEGGPRFEVHSYDISDQNYYPVGRAEVSVNINNPAPVREYRYTNSLGYGLAVIGQRVFFTPPVTADFTGKSGIYELAFHHWASSGIWKPKSQSRRLVEIDIQANEGDSSSNSQVIGLEAVSGKLVLLTAENGELKISSYDSDSGSLLGQADVAEVPLNGSLQKWKERSYAESYQAFTDEQQQFLYLIFTSAASLPDQVKRLVLTIDVSEGVHIADLSAVTFTDGTEGPDDGIKALRYKDGKLYAVRMMRDAKDENSRIFFLNSRSPDI